MRPVSIGHQLRHSTQPCGCAAGVRGRLGGRHAALLVRRLLLLLKLLRRRRRRCPQAHQYLEQHAG